MINQILLNIIAAILVWLYWLALYSLVKFIAYLIRYIIKKASIRKSIRLLEKNGFQKEATDILNNGVCEYVFRLYDDSGNTRLLVVESALPHLSDECIKEARKLKK